MCLFVLQWAKKFRCLECLDKMDKNMEPRVFIRWSLVNCFCFNLYQFWGHIFHDLLFLIFGVAGGNMILILSWYIFLRISHNQTSLGETLFYHFNLKQTKVRRNSILFPFDSLLDGTLVLWVKNPSFFQFSLF
jgi:hypothetical protein